MATSRRNIVSASANRPIRHSANACSRRECGLSTGWVAGLDIRPFHSRQLVRTTGHPRPFLDDMMALGASPQFGTAGMVSGRWDVEQGGRSGKLEPALA